MKTRRKMRIGIILLLWAVPAAAQMPKPEASANRIKVAAIMTAFYHYSHAHVILENFLEPYLFNGHKTEPNMNIVSFYIDQRRSDDMAGPVAHDYQIAVYPTIAGALCLGGDKLAVDAVLLIGEHGDYPVNEKGQKEYPRKRFFDETVAVFRKSHRVVPVYTDKHLSYRWDWAKEMYDTAQQLKIPLMAGSSGPLAQRRPPLELPPGSKLVEAVSIHGGPLESYGFHAMEILESFIEIRPGGESGVSKVQYLEGDGLWEAAAAGLWSPSLAEAALAAELGQAAPLRQTLEKLYGGKPAAKPHAILITYRDGLRALILKAGNNGKRWDFACRLEGETAPRATSLYVGPWENRNLFKALAHAIQYSFQTGQTPYPIERTLLTTGILCAAMDSYHLGGQPLDTPDLDIKYQVRDFSAFCEMGASWKIITDSTPEPQGIAKFDLKITN